MKKAQVIVMKPNDNVGTVVETVEAGTDVTADIAGAKLSIMAAENIPFGHKLALYDINDGDEIRKYGEVIGIATRAIRTGQHVHVHNLESCRGRGDK